MTFFAVPGDDIVAEAGPSLPADLTIRKSGFPYMNVSMSCERDV